jgi:hypothetical protein
MTSEEKLLGNDVTSVMSGALGDAIVVWLDACASKGLEPRLSAKTGEVKLLAGPNSWAIACTPESMKAAMIPFKGDIRFQRAGVARNGYTSCMYLLSHPKDIPYAANGHTRGTHQTEGNTQTVTLGSVAKAEAAHVKAEAAAAALRVKLAEAEKLAAEKLAAIDDARQAEKLAAAAKAEKAAEKAAAEKAAAIADRAKLEAKIKKMREDAAKLEALLAA